MLFDQGKTDSVTKTIFNFAQVSLHVQLKENFRSRRYLFLMRIPEFGENLLRVLTEIRVKS